MNLTVASLRLYPIKSCQGVYRLSQPWTFWPRGPKLCLTDENRLFLSQRTVPEMAMICIVSRIGKRFRSSSLGA